MALLNEVLFGSRTTELDAKFVRGETIRQTNKKSLRGWNEIQGNRAQAEEKRGENKKNDGEKKMEVSTQP
jgi:hypothetical protein